MAPQRRGVAESPERLFGRLLLILRSKNRATSSSSGGLVVADPGSGDDPEAVEPAVTEDREDLLGEAWTVRGTVAIPAFLPTAVSRPASRADGSTFVVFSSRT